jgi:hypothetical protein
MQSFLLVLALSLLAADQANPAVDPDDVILTRDLSMVDGCTSLGDVQAKSGASALLGPGGEAFGYEQVLVRITARAAEIGANMVYVEKASSFFITSAKGTAYRCPPGVMAALHLALKRHKQRTERSMDLPERAIATGSGFVGLQAGVMNRPVQRVPFRGLPVAFFLAVRNETAAPVYVVARLSLKETPDERTLKVFPGKIKMLTWDTYGVPADRVLPLEIVFYPNEQRTTPQANEKTSLFFSSDDLKPFDSIRDPRMAPTYAIVGWKEMTSKVQHVAGTKADPELQQDIAWTLYREESKKHRDCGHSLVAAEGAELNPKTLQMTFPEAKAETLQDLAKRDGALEVWHVKSCEDITAYRVAMFNASDGGTDILVSRDPAPKP